MTNAEAKAALLEMGWQKRIPLGKMVAQFQTGYALGPRLKIDGIAGDVTKAAIHKSRLAGGMASPHISWRKTASRGNGQILVMRALLLAFEHYASYVKDWNSYSWYRDPAWNAHIHGAANSQHILGEAVDFPGVRTVDQVKGIKVFSAIEWDTATHLVTHGAINRPGFTVENPAVFPWPHSG